MSAMETRRFPLQTAHIIASTAANVLALTS